MQLFQMTINVLWFLTYFGELAVFLGGQSLNWYSLQRPNSCLYGLGNVATQSSSVIWLRSGFFSHFRGKHPSNYEDTLHGVAIAVYAGKPCSRRIVNSPRTRAFTLHALGVLHASEGQMCLSQCTELALTD